MRTRNPAVGVARVLATVNTTKVTITDIKGNLISQSTAGSVGLRSRMSPAVAAKQAAQDAARQAMSHGMREVKLQVQGGGSVQRAAIIRAIQRLGLKIQNRQFIKFAVRSTELATRPP